MEGMFDKESLKVSKWTKEESSLKKKTGKNLARMNSELPETSSKWRNNSKIILEEPLKVQRDYILNNPPPWHSD